MRDSEQMRIQLDWLEPEHRRAAFSFYKAFMPHARISKKEALCVAYLDANAGQLMAGEVIAAARLRPIGPYRLLTGVLIHPKLQEQGLGSQLMQALKPELGRAPSFLLCEAALCKFYQRHGFAPPQHPPAELSQLQRRYQEQGKPLQLMQYLDKTPS
ncbi:GNAT family N-acetyltransferase [Shewanella marisflavi]|uniref:GNAT family N-acetyltransferase n=2 Tax=Shewanella TaxID=22 RepID=A0ABX5WNB8_9GAMM|nr:GNAT family N-acetyltransferase [Shewanella marisflavi]QDF76062.1 GNAT family N-acetyltransferase [Shewanella marisflavi]